LLFWSKFRFWKNLFAVTLIPSLPAGQGRTRGRKGLNVVYCRFLKAAFFGFLKRLGDHRARASLMMTLLIDVFQTCGEVIFAIGSTQHCHPSLKY